MKIYRSLNAAFPKARRFAAIGIFDGVHRGHRLILQKAIRGAKRSGAKSIVITFDPHPSGVLTGHAPKILMSLEHRLRVFAELGLDEALVIRFDKRFASMTHDDFLNKILIGRLGMKGLSVGEDFRFGRRASGDAAYLRSQSRAFSLALVPPLKSKGRAISSTRIREAIEKGKLKEAAAMLGRPVSVYGTVIRGRGRGKQLGFPTANLDPHHETLPPSAVYAATGRLGKKTLKGVIHIGARPTFDEKDRSLEVHFLNFKGDLYGREIELFFKKQLRPIRRYADSHKLTDAIRADIRQARKALK